MPCSGYVASVVAVAGLEAAAAGNGGVPRHRLSASLLDVHLAEVLDGMLEGVALSEPRVFQILEGVSGLGAGRIRMLMPVWVS